MAVAACLAKAPALAAGVPSGQPVVLWQILWERVEGSGTQAVLRFLAPDVAAGGFEAAQADMDWLCATHAVPLADLPVARADSVVVAMMDRPLPRGVTDREAVRFFATYRIEAGACVPDAF